MWRLCRLPFAPSFCSFFLLLLFLKNFLARILGEVDNCACPSIAPLFFRGVWAAAVIHGAALALDLGLAVSRPWLLNVLSRLHRGPSTCFAVSGLCGLVQGCYAPETPVAPARSAPSGRSARRLLRSREWGDLAAERLKGEKIPRFQDQGAGY